MAVPDPYKAARATSLAAKASGAVPNPNTGVTQTTTPTAIPKPPLASAPKATSIASTNMTVPKKATVLNPNQATSNTATSGIDPNQFADWQAKTNQNYNDFANLSKAQFSYDPETDPGYQAQRQLAQLRAGDATKSAMESANEKGIFGSSVMTSQLGQIQQRAEQEAAAYIPEYRNQAYGQFQDRLAAAANLLNASAGRQDADRNYGLNVADRTGYITPDGSNELKSQLLALKGQAEAPGITAAERSALSRQADSIRAQLQGMGVDISGLGANVNQANAAGVNLGTRTLAGQSQDYSQAADTRDYSRGVLESDRGFNEGVRQADRAFEYTQGRDKVADQRWQAEFDRIKEQDGLQNALAWAGQYLNEDRFKYDQMKDAATAGTTKTVTAATAGDMLSQALQKVVGQDENGNDKYGVFSDPGRREEAFVNMINTTGLRGNDVVTALTKAGYKINEINALQKEYPEVFQ